MENLQEVMDILVEHGLCEKENLPNGETEYHVKCDDLPEQCFILHENADLTTEQFLSLFEGPNAIFKRAH